MIQAEPAHSFEVVKSYCNRCKGERNHFLVMKHITRWSEVIDEENGYAIDGADTYECLQCCGCDAVHLRHTAYFSEEEDDCGRPILTVKHYPPKEVRHEPRWFGNFGWTLSNDSREVKELLSEVYRAIGAEAWRLAAMGVRAMLEVVMVEKVGDTGTFKGNLLALQDRGLISPRQHEHLKQVVEVGHASIHRGYQPTRQDVDALLDIVENVVEALYVSPTHAKSFEGRVPPRVKSTAPAAGLSTGVTGDEANGGA